MKCRSAAGRTPPSWNGPRIGRLARALVVAALCTVVLTPLDGRAAMAVGPSAAATAADPGVSTSLHRLLVEHVYLVGLLAKTIQDGRQDQLQPGLDAVDGNARALAELVGQARGPSIQDAFLAAWRSQVGLYVDYAFGAATGDAAKMSAATNRLNDARGNIDATLTGGESALSPGAIAELLRPQVQRILATIDAFASGDTSAAYGSLQAAAAGVPALADPLAEALTPGPAAGRSAAPAPPAAPPPAERGAALPLSTPTEAGPATGSGCAVSGPPARYAPVLADFGTHGAGFVKQRDDGYWGGNGYLVGFERGDSDAFQSDPWGGYVIAGVIVSADAGVAADDLRSAVDGWSGGWHPYESRAVPDLGDEAVALARLTPWEIANDQPMSEVFLAARRCNVVVHVLLAVMPTFDPVTQAARYARLMLERTAS